MQFEQTSVSHRPIIFLISVFIIKRRDVTLLVAGREARLHVFPHSAPVTFAHESRSSHIFLFILFYSTRVYTQAFHSCREQTYEYELKTCVCWRKIKKRPYRLGKVPGRWRHHNVYQTWKRGSWKHGVELMDSLYETRRATISRVLYQRVKFFTLHSELAPFIHVNGLLNCNSSELKGASLNSLVQRTNERTSEEKEKH